MGARARYTFENTPFLYAVQYSMMLEKVFQCLCFSVINFISKVVEFLDIDIFGSALTRNFSAFVCMY